VAFALTLNVAASELVTKGELLVQLGSLTGWYAAELASRNALHPGEHEESWAEARTEHTLGRYGPRIRDILWHSKVSHCRRSNRRLLTGYIEFSWVRSLINVPIVVIGAGENAISLVALKL
jgi:hypothetical protein